MYLRYDNTSANNFKTLVQDIYDSEYKAKFSLHETCLTDKIYENDIINIDSRNIPCTSIGTGLNVSNSVGNSQRGILDNTLNLIGYAAEANDHSTKNTEHVNCISISPEAKKHQGKDTSSFEGADDFMWNSKRQKQIAHTNVERRRRSLINDRMAELQRLLFPGRTKCQKSAILQASIDRISRIRTDHERIKRLEETISVLRQDKKELRARVQRLEALNKETNKFMSSHYEENNQSHQGTSERLLSASGQREEFADIYSPHLYSVMKLSNATKIDEYNVMPPEY